MCELAQAIRDAPALLAVLRGPRHVIDFANDALVDLVGRDRPLIGRRIADAFPELAAQGFVTRLDRVLATGETIGGHEPPLRLVTAGARCIQERYFNFTYAPLRGADGGASGVVAHGSDVTDHVRATRDAEDATRRREEILGMVSHDLRNPLSVIAMAVETLTDPAPPDAARVSRAVSLIERSASSMRRMIDDLLDITSIESGHLACELTRVASAEIVVRALDNAGAVARDAKVTLVERIDPRAGVVLADTDRLLQAVGNLLANAIRFTPPGGQVVAGIEAEHRAVRFTVEDTGVGIPAEDLLHVFDRFWHRRRGRGRGTGLGLAIARGIVEAHGGRLTADSIPGHGSRFSFTIPSAATAAGEALIPDRR
jgi:signal transduction histidine kinase